MAGQTSPEKQDIFKETIRTLVSVMEYKSEFFRGHSERVSANCILFASYLALQRNIINNLYVSGLLYDIGMVYIPEEIIDKTGNLSEDEFKIVREHSVIAENILSHLSYLKNILPLIRHHHENFRGDGYPDRLKGEQIPVGARILSILDSYDAMTSIRSHRSALSPEEALEQIRAGAGTIYDPKLADEFIRFMISKRKPSQEKKAEPQAADVPAPSAHAAQSAHHPPKEEENPIQKAVMEVVQAFKHGIVEVPPFPLVIQKIENALRSPDKGLEDVARIIEQDQAVTLRLLRTARSAHYGSDANILTVSQALSRIGLKDSLNIVTVISMKFMYEAKTDYINEIMEKIWIHSVAAAHTARAVAKQLHHHEDMLFLLGLTHDVGKVLLLNALSETLFKKGHEKSFDMGSIMESIQSVHAGLGSALLKKWGFKNEMISAVGNHETPNLSSGGSRTNLILYLANMLTRKMGYSLYEELPDVLGQVVLHLGLNDSVIDTLLEDVNQTVHKTITS